MRNFKKFLALVMATLMILSAAVITTGAADSKADYTEAAQHLVALKIMKGDEKGNLMLENGVTRYQAALFFAQTLSGETRTEVWNADKTSTAFKDVTAYGTAIDYVYGRKVVAGRGNGVFGPDDAITYQDMLVMAVRALGYETEDMQYPYGYIIAAQKLGLTDNVENVNYKAALTRGETSQLIWDMLNTVIAVEDPINGKILYPEDKGLTEAIANKTIDRKTMLEDSGYADGKITGTITAFVEADKDDEDSVDEITVVGTYKTGKKDNAGNDEVKDITRNIKAADLGITADTPKVSYLGLPVTIYVDDSVENFDKNYDDGDASVVFADFETYTTVENLGKAGNIKWDATGKDAVLSLDGTKYSEKNYTIKVYEFVEDAAKGWQTDDDTAVVTTELKNAFDYDDGYQGSNTYGKVAYRIIEDGDKTDAKNVKDVLEVLYTPYDFAQYFTRTLRYQPTSKDVEFVTLGKYATAPKKNLDDVDSYFVEELVGAKTASSITSTTTSVSKNQGEKAMSVTVEGESVKSGDFIFYNYNKLDNILTVAQTGAFKEGRLTGTTSSKKYVKIDGSNKEVGFKGVADVTFKNSYKAYGEDEATYSGSTKSTYIDYLISKLESGKNNVKYIEMDGNVVYMEEAKGSSSATGVFGYAVVTLEAKTMADLLGISESKYTKDLTSGLYIKDGYVQIAVLDTETGKWKLASLSNFHYGAYDADDEEFASSKDVATLAKYDEITESYKDKPVFTNIKNALKSKSVFLVVSEKNGVYELAGNYEGASIYNDSYLTFGTETSGLIFSNTTAKTNKLSADPDVEAARVSLTADTVIAIIDGTTVAIRTGVQKASKSLNFTGTAKVLAANSSLIVMDVTGVTVKNADKTAVVDLSTWGKSVSASANETYYVVLADYAADIDNDENDDYVVTLSNLFDLRTMKVVESVTVTVDTMSEAKVFNTYAAGEVLHLDEDGNVDKATMTIAAAANELVDSEDSKVVTVADINFEDADSIDVVVGDKTVSVNDATKINVRVVTINAADIDEKEYDLDRAIATRELFMDPVLDKEGNPEKNEDGSDKLADRYEDVSKTELKDNKQYYVYTLGADEDITINEPTAGVFDNFIIDIGSTTILVPANDVDFEDCADIDAAKKADVETITVELTGIATFSDGTLNMTIFKLVK